MPFKPNYNQKRSERLRAKAEKKQKKQQRREEVAAQRKSEAADAELPTGDTEPKQD